MTETARRLSSIAAGMETPEEANLLTTMQDVAAEVVHATESYPPFNSAHEGLAVIDEEFVELRTEVFKNPRTREYQKMYDEAKQLAAMAIRFMVDVDRKGCRQ